MTELACAAQPVVTTRCGVFVVSSLSADLQLRAAQRCADGEGGRNVARPRLLKLTELTSRAGVTSVVFTTYKVCSSLDFVVIELEKDKGNRKRDICQIKSKATEVPFSRNLPLLCLVNSQWQSSGRQLK